MTAPVFVDTNALVYSRDSRIVGKQKRAHEWLGFLWETKRERLSWDLQDRFSLSFWDALIVGAAKHLGCGYLLTEDLSAGQDLDGVEVVSPFERSPAELD